MSRIRVNSIKPIGGDSVSVSGSLVVTGNVTAEEFVTERVSTSIIYKSGSTKFGDTADDIHQFTGTLELTGSSIISSNLELGAIANVETYVSVATSSIATLDGHVGNIHSVTASHDTRITTAEGEIDQLQDSVVNLQINTGSQQTLINTNISDISALQSDLTVATASIAANETSIGNLNAATSSYALGADLTIATSSIAVNEADLTVATSSIAVNQTRIDGIAALTASLVSTETAYNLASGSYALSASLSTDYININQLKALSSGSADFAAFQAAIALL